MVVTIFTFISIVSQQNPSRLMLGLDKVTLCHFAFFILCQEILSCIIEKSIEDGFLQPIYLEKSSPPLSYLFFADDSIFLFNSSHKKCTIFSHIMHAFIFASRVQSYLQKSRFFLYSNINSSHASLVESILHIHWDNKFCTYLGIYSPSVP